MSTASMFQRVTRGRRGGVIPRTRTTFGIRGGRPSGARVSGAQFARLGGGTSAAQLRSRRRSYPVTGVSD